MSVYQHVLAGMQTEAAAMFARLLVSSFRRSVALTWKGSS
jgi:hypothetical protein